MKDSKKSVIYESIVIAANISYESFGFEKSTTNRIAEIAGVSIGSFYKYFPNKQALLSDACEKFLLENRQIFLNKLKENQTLSLEKSIFERIDFSCDHFLVKKNFFSVLIMKMFEVGLSDSIFKSRRILADEMTHILYQSYPEQINSDLEVVSEHLYHGFHAYMTSLLMFINQGESPDKLILFKNRMSHFFVNLVAKPQISSPF